MPDRLSLEFLHDPTVNYALQQNDVPVIKQLRITNTSDEFLKDLLVRIVVEPDFASAWEGRVTSLEPGASHSFGLVPLQLSPKFLAELTERVAGTIHVQVSANGVTLHEESSKIDVLAYDEWSGLRSLPEVLAAFVTPNHPVIEVILADAAGILSDWERGASLCAYQSKSKKETFRQGAAVYEAIRRRSLKYISPPASFESNGQKVRLAERILENGLGTCLDLALFLASCLEQAGLHPLIVFAKAHAFVGFWLVEETFTDVVSDNALKLRKRVELAEICLIEATTLTSASPNDFNIAVQLGNARLEKPEDFQCVIDIVRCRKAAIRPLPLRGKHGATEGPQRGHEVDSASRPPDLSLVEGATRPDSAPAELPETPATRLDRWKRKLLDLSLRNRLLNFRFTNKAVRILCPDIGSLEDALADGDKFEVLATTDEFSGDDPRSGEVFRRRTGDDARRTVLMQEFKGRRLRAEIGRDKLAKQMLEIYREATLQMEEGGASTMFLALGFLGWYESEASQKRHVAPLILVPVELSRGSALEGFRLRKRDDEVRINTTLLEFLSKDFQLTLPGMDPVPLDAHGVDVPYILNTFREAVKGIDRWEVVEDACLGFFSFAKFLMWRDMEARTEELLQSPVVSHLVNTPERPFPDSDGFPDAERLDHTHSPTETFCPVLTDSSQLAAVYAAAEGKSFVLHGPPGTGKSQTITNLIAHCLACGKSVLFVSEKMAALSVVRERLNTSGLGDFCLELHSNKSSKQDVIKQLGQSLAHVGCHDTEQWQREAERLAALRAELNEYVQALHKVQHSGETAFQGLSKLIGLKDVQHVSLYWDSLGDIDRGKRERLWKIARDLHLTASGCGAIERSPWTGVSCDEWSPVLQRQISKALQALSGNTIDLRHSAIELLPLLEFTTLQETHLADYAGIAAVVSAQPHPPAPLLRGEDLEVLRTELDVALGKARRFFQLREWLCKAFNDELLALDFEQVAAKVVAACGAENPPTWGGEPAPSYTPQMEQDALALISGLGKAIGAFRANAKELMQFLGTGELNPTFMPRYEELAACLCAEPRPSPALMSAEDWPAVKRQVLSLLEKSRRRQQLSEGLLTEFAPELLTLDLDALAAVQAAAEAGWGLGRWFKQRAIRKALRPAVVSDQAPKAERLGTILAQACELRDLNAQWTDLCEAGHRLLGSFWSDGQTSDQEVATIFERKEQLAKWAQHVSDMSGHSAKEAVESWLRTVWPHPEAVSVRIRPFLETGKAFQDIHARVCAMLGFTMPVWQAEQGALTLERLEQGVTALLQGERQLSLWLRWRDALYASAPLGQGSSLEQLLAVVRQVRELNDLKTNWPSTNAYGKRILEGEWADGSVTDERLVALFDQASAIRTQAKQAARLEERTEESFRDRWAATLGSARVERLRVVSSGYVVAHGGIIEQTEQLRSLLGPEAVCLRPVAEAGPLTSMEQSAARLSQNMDSFKGWCHWRAARSEALGAGLKFVVSLLESGKLKASEVETTIQRGYYQWWVECVVHAEPVLRNFFSSGFEDKIRQFCETDERYMKLTRDEIRARLASRVPLAGAKASGDSEMGVLSGQLVKKRSHMSIRALVQRIPNLLPRLKPCLLMSPMSIAQYLDAGHQVFDLVVFDEASQIPVWDAVGAIARGRQAIIVGDPKQLPPTNFFQREEDDMEVDDDTVADQESILDECLAAQLPQLHLRWHYRSRNESLIAFSNHHYYDNNLLTFPSPHLEPGVSFRHVPGVYDKAKSRTNKIEAEALVQEMLRRFADPVLSAMSIGVVTFSMAQRDLIADLLESQRTRRPEIERFFDPDNPERVFIKNLENVQGDERDAIFFSVGYGPDAVGKVSMSFGPLNRDGGERRLNVAVTRARVEVVLFSSLRPEQIDLARTRARGVQDLKCYMEYAERGMAAIREAISRDPSADFDSPFEQQVCEALRAKGHTVHAQVGCSGYRIDLGVVAPDCPGRYLIGIECDGANYHRSHTARDRDKLREMVLRGLGWEIARIWSTDWWQNPQAALAKVEVAIEDARLRRETEQDAQPEECPPPVPLFVETQQQFASGPVAVPVEEAPTKDNGLERYQPSPSTMVLGPQEEYYWPQAGPDIRQAILEVTECEAPMSLTLLTRRVAARWNFSKATEKCKERISAMAKHMPDILIQLGGAEPFIWRRQTPPSAYTGFRVPGDDAASQRDAGDIPPEEIANAARHVLKQHISASREVLEKETAYLLGYKRVKKNVAMHMQEGVRTLAKAEGIKINGENLVLM